MRYEIEADGEAWGETDDRGDAIYQAEELAANGWGSVRVTDRAFDGPIWATGTSWRDIARR